MKKLQFYALILLSFLIIGCDKEKQKEQLLREIQGHEEQEQYAEAFEKSSVLVKKFPNDSQAHLILGNILADMERFAEAKKEFSKAIELDPQNIAAYLLRIGVNLELNLPSEALADCPRVIQSKPGEEVYDACAKAAFHSKDYKQAVNFYSKIIELNPKNADAYYWRSASKNELQDKKGSLQDLFQAGISYIDQGKFEKAIKSFDILVKQSPNPTILRQRGRAKIKIGDLQGAEQDYAEAIALDQNDWKSYMFRCSLKAEQKDYRGVMQDCKKVISLAPKNSEMKIAAWSGLITAQLELQNYSGAYQISQTAIHDMPNVFDFYVLRAVTIRNFKEKLSAITQALQLYEQRKVRAYNEDLIADAYTLRGELRQHFGEHKGAIQDFTKVIEFQPNKAKNYQKRATSKQQIGDTKGAQQDFAQAEKLSSQNQ